ncbi:MAG TPA: hypothetical protein VFW02_01900 [Candidatus Limnocylindrales bacterium]|nr:hypothetical protein [Candidatus Limnocylindrales bacterium]
MIGRTRLAILFAAHQPLPNGLAGEAVARGRRPEEFRFRRAIVD